MTARGPAGETGLAGIDAVRLVGEALEDAAMRYLGRDLGTLHRDDIARAAIAVLAPIIAAQVETAVEAAAVRVEGLARTARSTGLQSYDQEAQIAYRDAAAAIRTGGQP